MLTLLKRMKGDGRVPTASVSSFRDWVAEATNFSGEAGRAGPFAHVVEPRKNGGARIGGGRRLDRGGRSWDAWAAFCVPR